ncbi:MAG TPA: hypothetical protein VNR00_04050 [Opitutus sp.]|nr:hypothetical protein [Opitutus sp.]
MDDFEKERPISPARLSKTPSWITLGFVLGALFVLALPKRETPRAPVIAPPPEATLKKLERPKMTEIEAVFSDWGDAAIWQNDRTEVALWDAERRAYSILFEVLRDGEHYYFRSIDRLTRPLVTTGAPENSPLLFTTPVVAPRERRSDALLNLRPPVMTPPERPAPTPVPAEPKRGD